MLNKLGVNLDFNNNPGGGQPGGRPDPQLLSTFSWVRLTARRGAGFQDYLASLQARGIMTIVILGPDSYSASERESHHYEASALEYAQTINPSRWQIGNEPDQVGPSSWTMSQSEYADLVGQCASQIRGVRPEATIITAGLASGQPNWLRQCGELDVDGVSIHPYTKRPEESWPNPGWGTGVAGDLLDGYLQYGKDLYVTEYGTDDSAVQAEYYARMYTAISGRPDTVAVCAFCYSDNMVPPFGLMTANGTMKGAYTNLKSLDVG